MKKVSARWIGGHLFILFDYLLGVAKRLLLLFFVQLQCLALRDVSHSGCAAEEMPLRQIVLCLSEVRRMRIM